MDFIQKILQYYHTESRHGFTGAVLGGVLLIAGLLLWRFARPLSLLKGLSLPFLVIGLVVGIGGFGDGYVTRKALPEKLRLYQENKPSFFKEEVPKVERTHRSWLGIRVVWGVLTLAGAILLFTMKKKYWLGVGLGTLLMGIAGNTEEAISMRFNERYYQEVLQAAKSQIITQIKKTEPIYEPYKLISAAVQQPVNQQNILVENGPSGKQRVERDTLPALHPVLLQDTIQISFEKPNEALAINDLTDRKSIFEVTENTLPIKSKKLLDYYRSDLIRENGVLPKHCWSGKKYLH